MNCPNCTFEILDEDKYCSKCGQRNTSLRITLKEFLSSFFEEYLSFDTRFFRSIGPLLFKPAFLANKFFEGKRKKYLNPLRFYVFISFITFLLAGFADLNFINVDDSNIVINEQDTGTEKIQLTTPFGEDEEVEVNQSKIKAAIDQLVQNKDIINANIIRYLSVALFFLMPIFALINFLVFFRRKDFYLEHLILSFQIHTFFLILSIVGLLVYFASDFNIFGLILLCLTIYTVMAMKKYYNTSWGGSIWRFFVSVGTYSFILLMAVAGISLIAVYFSGATEIFNLGS